MNLVRATFARASADLCAGFPLLERLVGESVLDGMVERLTPENRHRALRVDNRFERWIEYDPAWSRSDIWARRVAMGFDFATGAELEAAVSLKIALKCSDVPFDDGFLLAVGLLLDGRALTKLEAKRRLRSKHAVYAAAVERYAELHGVRAKTQEVHRPRELDDVMEDAPAEFQAVPGTCLDEGRGILFEKPPLPLTSRVGAAPPDRLRWLATLAILVHPLERNHEHVGLLVGVTDCMRSELGVGRAWDPDAVAGLMRRLLAREVTGRVDDIEMVRSYRKLRDLVLIYLEWQKPDPETVEGAFIHSLLPPALPPGMIDEEYGERDRLTVERLKARALSAGQVARRAKALQVSLHARFRQWDRLTNAATEAMDWVLAELAAGRPVELPLGVSDTWKVIRPDGTIAPCLKQRVDMEIVSEEGLLLEMAQATGWAPKVMEYMDAATKAQRPTGGRKVNTPKNYVDGKLHVPGGGGRLFARYVGTFPAGGPGDEFHPPFLVPLYENSVLVSSHQMDPARIDARDAMVAAHYLEPAAPGMPGLTWWVERKNEALPHLAMRHLGKPLMPMRELRLTLAYGTAIARLELMTGQRLGETMQARRGGGFGPQELPGGRVVDAMRGRPKGWTRDRWWVVDPHTMALLRRIRRWVVEIWYPGADLPTVGYGRPRRNATRMHCPAAQYLFQIGGRAADGEVLNRCLRIATLGIVNARAHDYRYAFAKLLSVKRGLRRLRAAALSHDGDGRSPMPEQYGDWDCDGLDDADAFVAEFQEEQLHGLLEGYLDACVA